MTDREFKLDSMFSSPGGESFSKSPSVWGQSGSIILPLLYLRRPKWIKNDSEWEFIVNKVFEGFNLPADFTLTKQAND